MRRLIQLCLVGVFIGLGCLIYGFFIEPKRLVLRTIEIESSHWTGAPLRIGLASDIHIGGRGIDTARVEKIVQALNTTSPDVILLAGDFINGHLGKSQRSVVANADIAEGLAALGALQAPLGTHAVIGNHDYLYGRYFVQSDLEAAGITILDNRSISLGDRACLFGMDDDTFGTPTLAGHDTCPEGLPKIGMMHSPDVFFDVPPGTALTLAGHTHGGQIVLPFVGRLTPTQSGKATAYGRISVNNNPGFVTAGIGMSILPARFRAPPEIVVITLSAQPR